MALALFWWERVSSEVIALGLLLALAFTGLLPAKEAFAGFGSDTVIMILGLLILTAALERTGVVELAGRAVLRHAGTDPDRLLWIVMLASAGTGAFMSNTASTAFFLPMVFGIAKKSGIRASRLLMPLAFSSIVTSSVTLVSTSTNMVVSGMISSYGLPPMGMFELAPVGIPIAVVGLVYMFLARRFIPDRGAPAELTEEFGVRPYLSEIVIQPGSALAGKTLGGANVGQQLGLEVLRIIRNKNQSITPRASTALKEGDVLLVKGSQEDIVKIKDTAGVEIIADARLSDPDLASEDTALVEAVLLPGSPLIGRTLKRQRFRESYGLQVLGINHHGVNVVRKLSEAMLALGDVLLVQGRREDIAQAHESHAFRVLGPMEQVGEIRPRRERAPLAIAIFVGVIALVTMRVLTLPMAVMLGTLLVFVTRCITPPGGLCARRMEGDHPHRQHAQSRRGDGAHRRCEIPRLTARLRRRKHGSTLAAHRLLRADRLPDAADVQPGRRDRRPADRHPNRAPAWSQPAHFRDDDRRGCELLVSHAARAGVSHGLWAGSLSFHRFS